MEQRTSSNYDVLSPTELGPISLLYKGILSGSFYNSVALFRSHKLGGNSLEVQWLGLVAFTAEGPGSIPGQGTKVPKVAQHGQEKKKCHKLGEKSLVLQKRMFREGPQGEQDVLSQLAGGAHGTEPCPATGRMHMGASRAEDSAHRSRAKCQALWQKWCHSPGVTIPPLLRTL